MRGKLAQPTSLPERVPPRSAPARSQAEQGGAVAADMLPGAHCAPQGRRRTRKHRLSQGPASLVGMTTLTDRPNKALIVIDVQNGVVTGNHERDAVVANISQAVDKARSASVPVVWVQDYDGGRTPGSDPWKIVPELDPADSDPHIDKLYPDAFEDTQLEAVLADLRVGSLVVVGAQSDQCIRSTLHGAVARGYDAVLVSDAHTTEDLSEWGAPTPDLVIAHTNLYWGYHTAPGRTAGTTTTAELDFSA
jgi:isochorismate hydrolase